MAQEEFSFKLYFEDALGNKDTIIIGYDDNATNTIDASFGELDILSQPWRSTMEVRTGELLDNSIGTNAGPYPEAFTSISHSKKQIIKKDCSQAWSQAYNVFYILLKNVEFPLTIIWDYQEVLNPCTSRNFMTDWYPGCWFDCYVVGTEQEPFDLNNLNTKQLNYISIDNVEGVDTTQVLFVSMSNFTLNTNQLSTEQFTISNNPFEDSFSIHGNITDSNIQLLDGQGKVIGFEMHDNTIIPLNCEAGVYFLSIEQNGNQSYKKIIKL